MKRRLCSVLLSAALVCTLSAPALAALYPSPDMEILSPAVAAEGAKAHAAVDAAQFPDASQITHWEAVAALSQLGVISGKDDGAFHPGDPVTRAEAAKLLFLLAFGGQDVEYVSSAPADFSDISGHWAEKYMIWCVRRGIISGRGDGSIDPDGNVTSLELSKMLLVLLHSNRELTGPFWDRVVYTLSTQSPDTDLYNGLPQEARPRRNGSTEPYTAAPLSRENAAQMLYNALSAPVITYSADWGAEINGQWADPADENGVVTLLRAAFPTYRTVELEPAPAQPGKP